MLTYNLNESFLIPDINSVKNHDNNIKYLSPATMGANLTNYDFPMSITGFATSLLQPSGFDNLVDSLGLGSLLGQTSYEQIAAEGAQFVKNTFATFERDFKINPSKALTDLSRELNKEDARYILAIENASSRRTKEGLPKSWAEIKKALVKFNEIEQNISKSYNLNKVQKTDSYNFKRIQEYNYFEYNLTKKPTVQNVVNDFSNLLTGGLKDLSPIGSDKGINSTKKTLGFATLLLVVPFGLVAFGVYKLIKKFK